MQRNDWQSHRTFLLNNGSRKLAEQQYLVKYAVKCWKEKWGIVGRLLHSACGGQGPGDLLAVRLSLVEKHPYQIIQKYPGRQTKQPLKKRERESYMTCIVGWFSLKWNESCLFQMNVIFKSSNECYYRQNVIWDDESNTVEGISITFRIRNKWRNSPVMHVYILYRIYKKCEKCIYSKVYRVKCAQSWRNNLKIKSELTS